MKLTLSILLVISLVGCASTKYNRATPEYQRCSYEAKIATAAISSPIVAIIKEDELIGLCMSRY